MKKIKISLLFLVVCVIGASTWFVASNDLIGKFFNESQPDMKSKASKAKIGMEEYLKLRTEHTDLLQGFDTAGTDSRAKAVRQTEVAEREQANKLRAENQPELASWISLGPAPLPTGGTPNSGRVSAIAVHPTNPDIVYVGAAQGGLYRSLNGGTTWTPLMDSALTIAIGAVAISPSDPTTIYVGTGESTLCGSGCYIGVGLYRITNADTSPVLSDVIGASSFSGRAISEVLVHPTDPNTIFVSTTTGVSGIGGQQPSGIPLPALGVYRSTNATTAVPTFTKLALGISDRSVTDMVMEPGNGNRIYVGVLGAGGTDGGVYSSANALDATPTFTQLLATALTGSGSRVELAATKVGGVTTVIAASGDGTGTVHRSVDAAPFTLLIDNNFCNPQCFYDIAVAIDPTDANRVYLGGSPTLVFGRSTTGGTSFSQSAGGLHVDTQAMTLAPSDPTIMYFGSDGGIWKTTNVRNAGAIAWISLNNATFSATQFMGLSLHPLDRHYAIGGTQDNGTEYLFPSGTQWIRSDGGDGGFAVIDKTATSINDVIAYHTYFNQTNNQIGFARAVTTEPNGDPFWADFFGCGGISNGIACGDAVLFYAPMVGGPVATDSGGKNTLYFGTNRLYRSANQGVTMTDVSGTLGLGARVSAIAIAPQDDNIRLIGTTSGRVLISTTAGATTMTDISGGILAAPRYVGRIAIDPTNTNIAYVALNGYGLAAGQHVWKTTNLLNPAPTWTASGTGIPDTPVNSFAIDPANTQVMFAGTDIGVFKSSDGGANWTPFNNGLPRIAVFGMEIQPIHRILKIATHGRGMYEISLAVSRSVVSDFDGDAKSDIAVFRPSDGNWYRRNSSNGSDLATGWGLSTDAITPGDYDGDGKTDLAVFRPTGGFWFVNQSTGGFTTTNFGLATDLPTQGDYDGDGKTDIAVFRPSTGEWYLNRSTAGFTVVPFGLNGDRPVPGDYDADGKTDVAVFRPSDGIWYILRSTAGFTALNFGVATDKVVPADYDGDGKTDIAIFRPGTGQWYILRSQTGLSVQPWGLSGDIPAPGDFDGDGNADVSVFRPSDGNWYRLNSSNGSFFQLPYGTSGDRPVAAGYVPVQ